MLIGYFDESGTHDGSLAMTIAGYVAHEEQWGRFEQEWRALLNRESLSHFHMTDFENRQGQFKGWGQERRIQVIGDLIAIIKSNFLVPVSASLILREAALLNRFAPPNSPYTFCVQECFKKVGQWAADNGHTERIAYVFEGGAGYGTELEMLRKLIFAEEERKQRLCFRSLTFADKKEALPLQAADLLAYESFKEMHNGILGAGEREVRKSFRQLVSGQETAYRRYCRYYNQESFLTAIACLPQQP